MSRRPPAQAGDALPDLDTAIACVQRDYARLIAQEPDAGDIKHFAAHYAAARAVLVHLEALRKLRGPVAADDPGAALLAACRAQAPDSGMAPEEEEGDADAAG